VTASRNAVCSDCGRAIAATEKAYTRSTRPGEIAVLCEACFTRSAGKYYFARRLLAKVGCLAPIIGLPLAVVAAACWGWRGFLVTIAITAFVACASFGLLQILVNRALDGIACDEASESGGEM